MRLKGGADDKIYYYDFESSAWYNGNTEGKYNVSIKYYDDTKDIAIEVASIISELIEKGVMDKGKIERINIDVTTKNGEHKIGNNFKIYWSENKGMITVGCEYNGNCAVHRINQMYKQAYNDIEDEFEEFKKQINQLTEQAIMEMNAIFEAAKNKSFNEENEVAGKIDQEFGNYVFAYQQKNHNFPRLTFEEYIKTFSRDKEKMLNYLKKNPDYFSMLIDDYKHEVQWNTDSSKEHRLVATTVNDDDKTNSLNNTNLETINPIDEKKTSK